MTQTVSQLRAGNNVDEITVTIIAKEPARYVRTDKYQGLRASAIGRDDTGEIRISLWGVQAADVELGDVVEITNGLVQEYQGDRVLSTGKFGDLQIVSEVD